MAISLYGEEQARSMSRRQLELLERQLADVRSVKLPTLEELKAEELGESAVAGMKSDPALRSKQMQAIATLQNIIDQGGLDLTDQAALEQAMGAATNQQKRARAGVAGDAAARGQSNSGARLVMDMDAAQAGSNAARQTGLETAAMAQRRRLQAIRDAGSASAGLREQDWREGETANRAKDIRDERNAAAREKAQYYNAGLPQQRFANAMGKATGQMPATSAVGNAYAGGANDARGAAAGMVGAAGAYGNVDKNAAAQTYNYSPDSNQYAQRGSPGDISEDDEK